MGFVLRNRQTGQVHYEHDDLDTVWLFAKTNDLLRPAAEDEGGKGFWVPKDEWDIAPAERT